MIEDRPISLADANAYVERLHRHHPPVHRDKYRVAAYDTERGEIVGVVQVGRPVARMLDDGSTLEVVRLCSDGTPNVCTFLYSRAARIAKELGYERIITYILDTENGASLRACGWTETARTNGGEWSRPSRARKPAAQSGAKKRFEMNLKGNRT